MTRQKKLIKIFDPEIIRGKLKIAHEKKSEVVLWRLKLYLEHRGTGAIKSVAVEHFEVTGNFQLGDAVVLNCYLPEQGVLFETRVVQQKDTIRLKLPDMIVQNDRRGWERTQLSEHNHCRLHLKLLTKKSGDFSTRIINRPIWDLSPSGVAIIISKEEKNLFMIGDHVAEVVLMLFKTKLHCSVEVCDLEQGDREYSPYGQVKLRLKFINQNPKEAFVEKLVNLLMTGLK